MWYDIRVNRFEWFLLVYTSAIVVAATVAVFYFSRLLSTLLINYSKSLSLSDTSKSDSISAKLLLIVVEISNI